MPDRYQIAIVGAGPAGLSAAGRAAYYDAESGADSPGYVLLEAFSTFAKTIQKYQKGKHVMDEPGFLQLRSPVPFVAGKREEVLGAWQSSIDDGLNIRYDSEVAAIEGEQGNFRLRLQSGDVVAANNDSNRAFYCRYESTVGSLELPAAEGESGAIVLSTPSGDERIECQRIVARLGTVPPRRFVESCGIEIASDSPEAVPDVDRHYQSNVPGLYILARWDRTPILPVATPPVWCCQPTSPYTRPAIPVS